RDDIERIVVEHREHGDGASLIRDCRDETGTTDLGKQSAAAERRYPDEREQRRQEEHPEDELADRPALRDACEKHSDKGRPRYPPAPVEDRPRPEEALRFRTGERTGEEAQAGEVDEIRSEGAGKSIEDVERRPDHEYEQEEGQHDVEVEVAQTLDAAVETRGHRCGGDERDHDDERYLAERIGRKARAEQRSGDDVESFTHLRDSETER